MISAAPNESKDCHIMRVAWGPSSCSSTVPIIVRELPDDVWVPQRGSLSLPSVLQGFPPGVPQMFPRCSQLAPRGPGADLLT